MNEINYMINEKISQNNYFRPTRISKTRNCILLFLLLFIYTVENYAPRFIKNSSIFMAIFKPSIWILVIFLAYSFPKVKLGGKISLSNTLKWYTTLSSILYICIMILVGIIGGFAKSPYNHSLYGNISNTILVFSALTGREMTRSYLINNHKSKNKFFIIGIIALILTIIDLPISSFNNIKTKLDFITFFGEFFLTTLCNNILASYLVNMGGPSLSIIYIGIQKCFTWYFPVLPCPGWNIKVLIDILYPVFYLMILEYIYSSHVNKAENRKAKSENPLGWIVVTVISILIIWFAAGVFPVRPMVIATGSMEPLIYPGDVVLVKSIDLNQLKVGDIIQYKSESIYIFHRIIEILDDNGEIKYQTKGDNNSAVDPEQVKGDAIRGKVAYIIPKVGWPTLFLRSRNDVDRSKVEF